MVSSAATYHSWEGESGNRLAGAGSQQRRFTTKKLVPGEGVEPTRLAATDFESVASANSAIRATQGRKARRTAPLVNLNFRESDNPHHPSRLSLLQLWFGPTATLVARLLPLQRDMMRLERSPEFAVIDSLRAALIGQRAV